jgi:hypothetical protein
LALLDQRATKPHRAQLTAMQFEQLFAAAENMRGDLGAPEVNNPPASDPANFAQSGKVFLYIIR